MILSPAEIAAIESSAIRLALFIRLEVDPPLRCWLGVGAIVDSAGETYQGFGQLLAVPAMTQLINGAADTVELSLSGVDERVLDLATFANDLHGVECRIGFALFDIAWSLLGAIKWTRRYQADYLRMTVVPAGTPQEQTTKSAVLRLASQTTGRRRPNRSYYTQQDQQARALDLNPALPTDMFCQWTPKYTIAGNKTWPKFA